MYENYTPQQIAVIRDAISKGRQALMRCDENPKIFGSAFIRAGGLNLPGKELDKETRRRMEIHIMTNINGRHSKAKEGTRIRAAILREVARIFGEVERFQLMKNPHLVGYQLEITDQVPDRVLCKRYTKIDAFGLGPGVIPPNEVVVLPPCCDGIRWKPVYET